MRKYCIVFCLLVFIGFIPMYFVSAVSPTDTSALIKQLQDQIKALQTQIDELKSQLSTTQEELKVVKAEIQFTKTLQPGVIGDEVKKLQEFLKTIPDVYPEGRVTGYFGPLTEAAIRRFQAKHGIESIGLVGPKTLEKLNEIARAAPAIPAIPAQPKPEEQIPAIPETPVIPAQPAVPPPIPAQIPVVDTTSPTSADGLSAQPATPAVPATPATPSPAPAPSPSPSPSPTPTQTPTPAPAPTPSPTPTSTPTPTPSPSDTTAPVITPYSWVAGLHDLTSTSTIIDWTTDELSNSEVEYGTTNSFGSSVAVSDLVTSHTVRLENLKPYTGYLYRVKSKDAAGNVAVSDTSGFTTFYATDPTPPVISNIFVDNKSSTKVVITWTTDVQATSVVNWGKSSTSFDAGTEIKDLVIFHSVTLSGLQAGTQYYYRVESARDPSFYTTKSDRLSFTTFFSDITLTSPNGGEQWIAGNTYPIAWTSSSPNTDNVQIELLHKEGSVTISEYLIQTQNTGSWNWAVPVLSPGNQPYVTGASYTIKITNPSSAQFGYDVSDSNFTISPAISSIQTTSSLASLLDSLRLALLQIQTLIK